jgi:hypothetical protein
LRETRQCACTFFMQSVRLSARRALTAHSQGSVLLTR